MSLLAYIVGPGRLGRNLGKALAELPDVDIAGVAYHSDEGRLRALEQHPDVVITHIDVASGLDSADVVLLTVRDDAIREAASRLAERLTERQVLLHTSGLHSSTCLRRLGIRASLGSFHPLQTFTAPEFAADRFDGCFIACEGDARAVEFATELAQRLRSRPVEVKAEFKVSYHAAAVVAANYLAVLTEIAVRLYGSAGIDAQTGIEMLAPLQRGVLENLSSVGLPEALTGPIARGDAETVRAHVEAIRTTQPGLERIYSLLGEVAVELARAQGQPEERLTKILGELQ